MVVRDGGDDRLVSAARLLELLQPVGHLFWRAGCLPVGDHGCRAGRAGGKGSGREDWQGGLWPGGRPAAGLFRVSRECVHGGGPGTMGGPRSVPFGRIFSPASTATGSRFPAVPSPLARHPRRPLPSGSASPPSPPLWLGIPAVPSPLARHPRRPLPSVARHPRRPSKPALPRFSRASGAGKPSRFTCRTSCHSILCSIDCGYVMVSIERGEGSCQLSHFPVTGSAVRMPRAPVSRAGVPPVMAPAVPAARAGRRRRPLVRPGPVPG